MMTSSPKLTQASLQTVAQNKKARHDYQIIDVYEAGLILTGSEVKSLRKGQCQLKDSYVDIHKGELFLLGTHISPYLKSSYNNHEPERRRKLLMHKQQIHRLNGMIKEKGLTLVPLKVYFKSGRAKVEIALVKGKKLYDKRETLKQRAIQRELQSSSKRFS